MKFCSKCGSTLSILNDHSGDLCQRCAPPSPSKQVDSRVIDHDFEAIGSATLSVKDGKIMLESKEGWLLWSGAAPQAHTLKTILDRANLILKIRKRQKK